MTTQLDHIDERLAQLVTVSQQQQQNIEALVEGITGLSRGISELREGLSELKEITRQQAQTAAN